MTAIRISASSFETVWLPIKGAHPINGAIVVPTDFSTVAAAFTDVDADAAPGVNDWVAAAWEAGTDTISGLVYYLARVTVGPGGAVTLTAGRWSPWLRITGATTPVVRLDDPIIVYP